MSVKIVTGTKKIAIEVKVSASVGEQKREAREVIDRMMLVAEVKNFKALGRFLGLGDRVPSAWVGAGAVPAIQVVKCARMTNTSIDWLYFGKSLRGNISIEEVEDLKTDVVECLLTATTMDMIKELEPSSFLITGNKIVSTVIKRIGLQVDPSSKE